MGLAPLSVFSGFCAADDAQHSVVSQFPGPPEDLLSSEDDLSQDEVIDYDHHDAHMLQSAYQEYLNKIDDSGSSADH